MSSLASVRSIVSSWPLPYRIAWLGVAMIVGSFLYITTMYWADLDQATVNRYIREWKFVSLISAPFESDSWDRVVVLAGCFWCWWQIRPKLDALPHRPMPLHGMPLLVLGLVCLAPVWFCYGQIGGRPVMPWLSFGFAIGCLVGLVLTQFGWRHLNAIRFVLFFSLIALPIPGRFNNPLQNTLQQFTSSLAYHGLNVLGYQISKEGFVLHLPSGDLGVVEACCGIRSLTSLIAIAAFVSFLWKFSPLRGALLLVLAVPVIILVNGLRVMLTGILQESISRDWAKGWRHELVGYLMVLLGLGLILLIAKSISPPTSDEPPPENNPAPSTSPSLVVGWIATVLVTVFIGLGVMAYLYPSVGKSAISDDEKALADFPLSIGEWTGEELPINPEITTALRYNEAICRQYRNRLGYDVTVWVMYWSTAKSVKGYHHPDVCMPNHGQEIALKDQMTIRTPEGNTVPITFREFTSSRAGRSRVIYWTQEGRTFWTAEDETAAFNMMFPFRWIEKRLGNRPADEFDDRIVVLIGTPAIGDQNAEKVKDFTGRLADALYAKCPWAKPKP